jgi:molybdopterin molybdotransferase
MRRTTRPGTQQTLCSRQVRRDVDVEAEGARIAKAAQPVLADPPPAQTSHRDAKRRALVQRGFERAEVRCEEAAGQRLQPTAHLERRGLGDAREPCEQRGGHEGHVAGQRQHGPSSRVAQRRDDAAQRVAGLGGLEPSLARQLRQRGIALGDDYRTQARRTRRREGMRDQRLVAQLERRLLAAKSAAGAPCQHRREHRRTCPGPLAHASSLAPSDVVSQQAVTATTDRSAEGGLIELDMARRIVRECAVALDEEAVALHDALGRVLVREVRADGPVPAFAGSAMDGYAIRAADSRGAHAGAPVALALVGESSAGHPASVAVARGQAVAISTGAPLPAGADAVIRVEDTRRQDGSVLLLREVSPRSDVRAAGEDIAAGSAVLDRGTRLGPGELGVLASVGCAHVACTRRAQVSVLTTGDELVDPTAPLFPGAVRDSNAYSIAALVRCAGASVTHAARVPDDPDATRAAIDRALDCDVVVVCGGVSVGAHDHVKDALAALGVERRFAGVALRPGKPAWFGVRGRTLVFGLPGNPVSAMVTFILLAGPALRALAGEPFEPVRLVAALASDYDKVPGRAHAIRCRLTQTEGRLRAEPTGPQASHILTSMLAAQALAIIPSDHGPVRAGQEVAVEPLWPWVSGACGMEAGDR